MEALRALHSILRKVRVAVDGAGQVSGRGELLDPLGEEAHLAEQGIRVKQHHRHALIGHIC